MRSSSIFLIVLSLLCLLIPRHSWANPQAVGFDANRSFDLLKKYVQFGNRYYQAPKRAQAIQMLVDDLKTRGMQVETQNFEQLESQSKISYPLTNIIGRLNPQSPYRVILGTHWDTRLWAEEDQKSEDREKPIQGANDGTSGIAVLLEMLQWFKSIPLSEIGIDIVFFDGEEFGRPGSNDYCAGSRYFAKHINQYYQHYPIAVIILDMVGDKQLEIPFEQSSLSKARPLTELLWQEAQKLGKTSFSRKIGPWITDDHTPFQDLGIQSILLIDYDYVHWHTHQDDLSKCSPQSLKDTGEVVMQTIIKLDQIIHQQKQPTTQTQPLK
jgi:glutaminyl-peptide cyclotransferase